MAASCGQRYRSNSKESEQRALLRGLEVVQSVAPAGS